MEPQGAPEGRMMCQEAQGRPIKPEEATGRPRKRQEASESLRRIKEYRAREEAPGVPRKAPGCARMLKDAQHVPKSPQDAAENARRRQKA